MFDNDDRVVYCIPSKPQFVESEAVRQNIHEREDAYPNVQDYADLRGPGALLFLAWQGSFATRLGLKSVNDSVRPRLQAVSAEHQASFRPRADQIDLACGASTAQDPPQTKSGKIP